MTEQKKFSPDEIATIGLLIPILYCGGVFHFASFRFQVSMAPSHESPRNQGHRCSLRAFLVIPVVDVLWALVMWKSAG